MDWCKSPIPEAIQNAKVKGTMFLVYIYGEDDQSTQMNAAWDSDTVSGWVRESGAVAVRIQSASEECKFFSQIYPVVCVPSTYCIGNGGIPLEVIGGQMPAEEFVNKLKVAQTNHESRKQSQATPSTQESTQSAAPGSTTSTSDTAGASGDQTQAQIDKVARARELIAKKQEEKAQKEFEKSREEEIKRRKLGKDLHSLKQTQQEMQMKEIKEQMEKDKAEEKRAREKIKAQIARDREERAMRFQKEKQDRDAASDQAKKAKLVKEQKQAAEANAKKSETARIQVRLPDGSSFTQTFTSTDTLQLLYNAVSERMEGKVSLSTTFPKHVFTEEEMSSSFRDLQLTPSAVVMALPRRSGGESSSAVSSGLSLFSMIVYPFALLWGFIYNLLFGGGRGPANQQQQPSQDSSSSQSSARSQRPNTAYQRHTNRSSPDSNMRRMTDMWDDDEDRTTYNGNSTQQL